MNEIFFILNRKSFLLFLLLMKTFNNCIYLKAKQNFLLFKKKQHFYLIPK
jgi:hypothetical protein